MLWYPISFKKSTGRQDLAIDEIRGFRFRHNRNKPAESVAKSQNRKTRISSMAAAPRPKFYFERKSELLNPQLLFLPKTNLQP